MRLSVARGLAKQIGIAAEILDRCERYRIDPPLQRDEPGGGELRDPTGERTDEIVELFRRQRD